MERDDDQYKAFHSKIQERTNSIRVKIGGGAHSLDSLMMVIRYLGDTNKDGVKVLLQWKPVIDKSPELRNLLGDYFNCGKKTLEFLNSLEAWLFAWRLESIKTALHDFKTTKSKMGCTSNKILLEKRLKDFMAATNPDATNVLYAKLTAVLGEQHRLHLRLQEVKTNANANNHKVLKKVSTLILASVYVGLLVCVAVFAVLSPGMVIPALAAVAGIAAMNPVDHIEGWLNEMWAKYEEKLRVKEEVVNLMMEARTRITIEDMEGIRRVMHELQDNIKGFSVENADVAHDPVVKGMVKDMEKKINEFASAVKDLKNKKEKCYRDIQDAMGNLIGLSSSRRR